MIPADVAGTNGIVRDAVERHLLHIEIAVEKKAAAVYDHERHKDDKGQSEAEKEGEEKIHTASQVNLTEPFKEMRNEKINILG